jgi:flagellar assembly protein FliH
MIWSSAMSAERIPGRAASSPSAWSLEELHAFDGELFHAASTEPVQTEEEVAAVAEAERQRVSAEAHAAGYQMGFAAAKAAAEEQLSSAIAALQSAATEVTSSETRFVGALEEHLATLAVTIARQIIAREVRTSPELIVDLVRHAVTEFPIDQPLRIRINPLDLSTLAAAPGGAAVSIAPGRELAWVADARIYPGGCIIEGRDRIIDGRVDAALERVYHRLIGTAE